jgi:hypothetical protein
VPVLIYLRIVHRFTLSYSDEPFKGFRKYFFLLLRSFLYFHPLTFLFLSSFQTLFFLVNFREFLSLFLKNFFSTHTYLRSKSTLFLKFPPFHGGGRFQSFKSSVFFFCVCVSSPPLDFCIAAFVRESAIGLRLAKWEAAPPFSNTDAIERKSEATHWTGQRQCGVDEDGGTKRGKDMMNVFWKDQQKSVFYEPPYECERRVTQCVFMSKFEQQPLLMCAVDCHLTCQSLTEHLFIVNHVSCINL